ncbi:hypothetical protein CYY_009236 [Polysphondylium violaceum]|uniref:Endoplasmic reticulum transmembrane protein n=1 Tax=Polysphondylium violaceum TaxID=133409 RepID=A0A8J4PM19_9MYCE|nr:hypothetical protein CYY_009236 [Polysphondylium violaceum]
MEVLMILVFISLILEVLFCSILMLPISMALRKKIFEKLNAIFGGHTFKVVFRIVVFLLICVFANDMRESILTDKKLHSSKLEGDLTFADRQAFHLKLFRSQRNIYMSGFCLFLYFLIYRGQKVIGELSSVEANSTAINKQIKQNQNTLEDLLKKNEAYETELKSLRKMEKEFKAMKSQAENTNTEYFKLKEEYEKLVGKKTKDDKKKD